MMVDIDQLLMARTASKGSYVQGIETLSYSELFDRAAKTATLFGEIGLKSSSRVAIVSQREHCVLEIFFALLRFGMIPVIVDFELSAPEMQRTFNTIGPQLIFAEKPLPAGFKHFAELSKVKVIEISRGALLGRNWFTGRHSPAPTSLTTRGHLSYPAVLSNLKPRHWQTDKTDGTDSTGACILMTRGRTGPAKFVQFSRQGLSSRLTSLLEYFSFNEQTRLLNTEPLHHIDGLVHGALAAFAAGCVLVRVDSRQPQQLLDSIYLYRITHLVTRPSVLRSLLSMGSEYRDAFLTEDFRFVISTGAPLDPETWEQFEVRFSTQVVNAYGVTETAGAGAVTGLGNKSRQAGAIGCPVHCSVRVADSVGADVPMGTSGELLIRCGSLMQGYVDGPTTLSAVPADDWCPTGDAALIEANGSVRLAAKTSLGGVEEGRGDLVAHDQSVGLPAKKAISERILHIAARCFMAEAQDLELGTTPEKVRSWTSLAHVELLLQIEKEFHLTLSPKDIMRIRSLGDAARIVAERLPPDEPPPT